MKKRIVISYNSLTPELKEELKKLYPTGFSESMIRIDKPSGDFFYAVRLETEDISYLVKIDVKIDDTTNEDEDDKDYFDDEIKGADELSDAHDDDDDE